MKYVVHSSAGDYTCDQHGCVVETPPESDVAIVAFDLSEYALTYGGLAKGQNEFDILDLGYWWLDAGIPKYEEPCYEWRSRQE